MTGGYAAVVLAGGDGRRLGGPAKPATPVGGRPMVCRVLDAVADAAARVVVGPPGLPLPDGVARTRERPPGGGPVAALAAGLAALRGHGGPPAGRGRPPAGRVVVLAADLALLSPAAVGRLLAALDGPGPAPGAGGPGAEAAVLVDDAGRRQWLCAAWRRDALERALTAVDGHRGAAVRRLYAAVAVVEVAAPADAPPAWWDCDTPDALARARAWLRAPSVGAGAPPVPEHGDQ